MDASKQALLEKLNLETGKLCWKDMERHFARGVVVTIAPQLDLLEVAACLAADDKAQFLPWFESGLVARASSQDATEWNERDASFWAVVVAPWLLVQEIDATTRYHG